MEILHLKELGDTESVVTNAVLCVYQVVDNFVYVPADALPRGFTPVSKLKAIGRLVMDILHFKDLGDTASVVTNTVVLVLPKCQISIPTYTIPVLQTLCDVMVSNVWLAPSQII